VRCVADVETAPIRWFWKDRIALGKITFLVGDPDEGKSYLTTAKAQEGYYAPLACGQSFFDSLLWFRHRGRCTKSEVKDAIQGRDPG